MRESYKLWIKRKMLLLIAAGLVLTFCSAIQRPFRVAHFTPSEQSAYTRLEAELRGPLTDDKRGFFEQEEARRASDQERYNAIWDRFDEGKLDEYALSAELAALVKTALVPDAVWKRLQEEFRYVEADPQRRQFINSTGWSPLVAGNRLDLVLVLLLLVLGANAFAYEYESGMAGMVLTCRAGRWRFALHKIGAVVLAGSLTLFLFEGVRTGVCMVRCGPFPWLTPIQSLPYFEGSPLVLTYGGLYLQQITCRILGAWWLLGITMLLSTIARKTLPALFGGLACVIVPYFLFDNRWLFRLPNPAGLLIASGYYAGGSGDVGGSTVVGQAELSGIICSAVVMTLIFLAGVIVTYTFSCRKGRSL